MNGERGDWVVEGEEVRAVVGGSVVIVVMGTFVCSGVAMGTTLNVFTPTYPFASMNVTS